MDQIIPILLAAIVFGFQAYANYRKEQEKARKRNFGKPNTDEFKEFEGYGDYGDVVVVEEKPAYSPPEPPSGKYSQYQGTIDQAQIRQARTQAKRSSIVPDVKLTDLDEASGNSRNAQEYFDLRQAVIQSAILERPFKD